MTKHHDPAYRVEALPGFPAFARELVGTLAVHAQYVLHGNIRDQYLMPPPGTPTSADIFGNAPDTVSPRPVKLLALLWHALAPSGYQCFICYDPVDGITVYPPQQPEARKAAERLLGSRVLGRKPSLERLRSHLARVAGMPEPPPLIGEPVQQSSMTGAEQGKQGKPGIRTHSGTGTGAGAGAGAGSSSGSELEGSRPRAAFIIDYAARITRVPGQLEPCERDFFVYCQKLALTAKPLAGGPSQRPAALFNPVIWLVEGERDLPAWLTAGVERIRSVAIPIPRLEERLTAAQVFAPLIAKRPLAKGDQTHIEDFAHRTDSMTIQSMFEITRLAHDRMIGLGEIADAVRIYKLGVEDNPWRKSSVRQQIRKGEYLVRQRVLGQERAINKTLDILKRAALGLSGAQATSSASRPRGVLFFAGPTGVGKTELAKQVAEILFGDANAYLRFDMSEFSADHAADRLTGAPPGYVGFEAGGELTGAVRRQPFQVILFDEIEKAHPLVLDKFLQILEDGRLTDGQGVTTHFSECVLIFTSNLGIIVTDPQTGHKDQIVSPGIPYHELEAKVKGAIREHFTTKISRPELLNRLGDNIVIFDFINKKTAEKIFDLQLHTVQQRLRKDHRITLTIEASAETQLRQSCIAELDHGGRGIGNQMESTLINPLARYLFDHNIEAGSDLHITAIHTHNHHVGSTIEAMTTPQGTPWP